MKKIVWLYGFLLATLVGVLELIQYKYWVRDLSQELFVFLIAAFFTVLGIWAGLKLTRKPQVVAAASPNHSAIRPSNNQPDDIVLSSAGISRREWEVLELMAQGLSNQEIADRLFISLNTVKTHSSNLFSKLGAVRRTQAIQRAKEMRLLNP